MTVTIESQPTGKYAFAFATPLQRGVSWLVERRRAVVCGDAYPILLLLGDGYLPGRQVGLCARKR
jgi:hypothetical protein